MKTIIMLLVSVLFAKFGYAQTTVKDTIYYLIDTAKVPFKDRMVEMGKEANFKFYTIKCPCLAFNSNPTFIYRIDKPSQIINSKKVTQLDFFPLTELVGLVKNKPYSEIKKRYTFIFIERSKKSYALHEVFFVEPKRSEVSVDYENLN